ncbi:MAG: peptidylprolyl isomerase [bacterium]
MTFYSNITVIMAMLLALGSSACAQEKEAAALQDQDMVEDVKRRASSEILAKSSEQDWRKPFAQNTLYMTLPQGLVVIELYPDLAPQHVAQVQTLVREGYYDGLSFYRVIEGFVAQGGDADGEKDKGSAAANLPAEFDHAWNESLPFVPLGNADGYSDQAGFINGFPAARDTQEGRVWLTHCSGAFAFGRDTPKDSASTEFYITLQPQRYLDRNLTVFGRVIWGMEHIQAIPRGEHGNGGAIKDQSRWTPIKSVRLAADIDEEARLPLELFDTNSPLFPEYLDARRNRPEDFFYFRPDYIDLCQVPLPVRLKPTATDE